MARHLDFFYNFVIVATSILVMVVSDEICDALGIPWVDFILSSLVVALLLSYWSGFHWLVRGGKGPRVAAALVVHSHGIIFALPVLINRAICRVRAVTGPGRDLFRGITHLRRGELEQAIEALERHVRRRPKELAGLFYMSIAFLKLGRFGEALPYLDTAAQLGAQPDALLYRGLVLAAAGASEEALQDIGAALRQRPKNRVYHFYHAFALVQAGRPDQALEVMRGPASPKRLHLNWWPLSLALQTNGDAAATADACHRALAFLTTMRKSNHIPWDASDEARLLIQVGQFEQGERAASRTLARNPGDHGALAAQALLHTQRGDTENALRSLQQAASRNPFVVVDAARDPAYAPLTATPGFTALLERATRDWEARLLAIRHRSGMAESGV